MRGGEGREEKGRGLLDVMKPGDIVVKTALDGARPRRVATVPVVVG